MTKRSRLITTTPLLVVADLQRSIDFYCQQLGFGDPSVWGEPPCFAMLQRDGFELMLSLAEAPARPTPNGPSGVWDVYLRVADVAAETVALAAAGLPLAKGPTDTFYEMREIEIVDPDGYRLCFAEDTTRRAPATAEVFAGVLDVGQKPLRLVLKLARAADGTPRGWLDSLDQNAFDLSLQNVTRTPTTLHFELAGIHATFDGHWSADHKTLSGHWIQNQRTWPLVMSEAGSNPPSS